MEGEGKLRASFTGRDTRDRKEVSSREAGMFLVPEMENGSRVLERVEKGRKKGIGPRV